MARARASSRSRCAKATTDIRSAGIGAQTSTTSRARRIDSATRGGGERPAAAQGREAEGLGEGRGRDEAVGEERRGRGTAVEHGVAVDLVEEHVDPALLRKTGERADARLGDEGARRIVRVRQDHEARPGRQRGGHGVGVDVEPVLEAAAEEGDVGAEHARRGRQRIVVRRLEEDRVPCREERRARRGSWRPSSRRRSRRVRRRLRGGARSPRAAEGSPRGFPRRCPRRRARRAGPRAGREAGWSPRDRCAAAGATWPIPCREPGRGSCAGAPRGRGTRGRWASPPRSSRPRSPSAPGSTRPRRPRRRPRRRRRESARAAPGEPRTFLSAASARGIRRRSPITAATVRPKKIQSAKTTESIRSP